MCICRVINKVSDCLDDNNEATLSFSLSLWFSLSLHIDILFTKISTLAVAVSSLQYIAIHISLYFASKLLSMLKLSMDQKLMTSAGIK